MNFIKFGFIFSKIVKPTASPIRLAVKKGKKIEKPSFAASRVLQQLKKLVTKVGIEITMIAVGTSQKRETVGVVSVAKPNPPTAFNPEPIKAAKKTRKYSNFIQSRQIMINFFNIFEKNHFIAYGYVLQIVFDFFVISFRRFLMSDLFGKIPDSHIHLLQSKALLFLATTMEDGSPQVSPLWFNVDEEFILINSAKGRVKDKNMRRNERVSLAIVDPENAFLWMGIQGSVVDITEEGADEHIDVLARKYLDVDSYSNRQKDQVRVIYKISVNKVYTMNPPPAFD